MAFLNLFRFIQNARQRRAEELQLMHERNVDLIETLFDRMQAMEKVRTEAAIAQAQAQAAQAEAMRVWFEMFKFDSQNNAPGHTVRPVEEANAEVSRARQEMIEKGYPVDGTPDEQMAFLLSQEFVLLP